MEKTFRQTPPSRGGGLITLITCTYNAAPVLQRTLDSVLQQTYPRIEHIIIDGRSKDDTISMAEQYKTHNDAMNTRHTIIIQSEPDKGLYDAMNKGIQKATGDYLCFLNAGDILAENDTIERLSLTLPAGREQNDSSCKVSANKTIYKNSPLGGRETVDSSMALGVIYGETDIVDADGNFLRHRRLQAPEKLTWRSFRHGMLVCHQAFYANTQIAKQTPYNLKYKYSADVDWCIRIMKAAHEQGLENINTHEVVCKYLEGGMSVKNHRASLKERFMIMCDHYGVIDTILLHVWFIFRSVLKK